ncbi:MAG: phage tail sheath family protein [Ruminococcus sp.]|nr:phage tail sheath family protein [Ruminococcus sp.]
MAEYLSPGVYVEEFESGGKPMEGVGTSTAGFVGLAEKGPVGGVPRLITNFADFRRTYGGFLSENEFGEYRFLAYAVEHFFVNGGTRCFITRVAPESAKCAQAQAGDLTFTAKDPGAWGDAISLKLGRSSKARTQALEKLGERKYRVKSGAGFNPGDIVAFTEGETTEYNKVEKNQDNIITFVNEFGADITDTELLPSKLLTTCELALEVRYGETTESYDNVSFNIEAPNFIAKKTAKSELIEVAYTGANDIGDPFAALSEDGADTVTVEFTGGSNGSASDISAADFIGTDGGAGNRTGIQSFLDNDVVSIMAVPGITDPNVQLTLVAHCENLASRFAILDLPRDARMVDEIIAHRDIFSSSYAALYHPWLQVFDPLDKKNIAIPPSGSVAGIFARSDNARGVHKAPANEVVRACVGLDTQFNKGEQDILNPKGVNLIRSFPGQGIRVWGARTASGDPSWKYVNVRRLFIFLEESIKANTNWAVFEPNDQALWTRVQRTISVFLNNMWRNGSLAGSSADEAFFVNIGRNTMSQDDIDNGRLVCVIGVAPVKPAEFVIFRITQNTGSAE